MGCGQTHSECLELEGRVTKYGYIKVEVPSIGTYWGNNSVMEEATTDWSSVYCVGQDHTYSI